MSTPSDHAGEYSPAAYPLLSLSGPPWDAFRQACREFAIPLDEDHHRILEALYSHLVGVNSWLNLTRLTEPEAYLKFHVLDSLTALPFVEELTEPGDVCLDLGSGGGYPGLPLMTWVPDRRWILVDSRRKKVEFLREAIRLTPCRTAEAAAFRGREATAVRPDLAGRCRLVIARAVGQADRILEEAAGLVCPMGWLLLLKGPGFARDERDRAMDAAAELGFELMHETATELDDGDPERLLVLFVKQGSPRTGRRRGKGRRRHRG